MSLIRSSLAPLGYVKVRSIRLLGLVLILFCLDRHVPYLRWRVPSLLTGWIFERDFLLFVQHCIFFRLSISTVLEDDGIHPRAQIISHLSVVKSQL